MKRTTALILAITATLLLSGCWPYWHDHGHGRDHGRYYGGQEYHRY
ncbi:lipoprotein [Pseudomonas frederiksbergensis]|nr:lipoprotein [Pseudomonas frederiksbergensis]